MSDAESKGESRRAIAVLAPPTLAIAALLVHHLLPDWQDSPPTGLYPMLLGTVLAITALLAVAQEVFRPLRRWVQHTAPLLAGLLVAGCLWDVATLKTGWMVLPYFPGPDTVLAALVAERTFLFESTYHSLILLLAGYSAGVLAGLLSGILIGWSSRLNYWGMPVLQVIGPIPVTVFVPLVLLLFPQFFTAAAALIALAVWFPLSLLTAGGIRSVPRPLIHVARTLGAGRRFLLWRVAIPAALPHIFLGLSIGLRTALLTLVVAETVGVKAGLGWYVRMQQSYEEFAKVYGALIILAVFCSGAMMLLSQIQDRILRWQKGLIKC